MWWCENISSHASSKVSFAVTCSACYNCTFLWKVTWRTLKVFDHSASGGSFIHWWHVIPRATTWGTVNLCNVCNLSSCGSWQEGQMGLENHYLGVLWLHSSRSEHIYFQCLKYSCAFAKSFTNIQLIPMASG